MGSLLMGYDIETQNPNGTRLFVEAIRALHRKLEWPFSLFCCGQTVALQPQYFAELARDPLIDIESHTYTHMRLKTVYIMGPQAATVHKGARVFRGGSVEQVEEEIAKTNTLLEPLLGRKVEGLTGPWGYYRGLADRPDLLDVCARHGLHFLRTWARDHLDGQPTPYQEPFFYSSQGHPEILECFVHGYQDDFYYNAFCEQPHPQGFKGYLLELAGQIASENLTWSACSHDHVAADADLKKKLAWLEPFLCAAKQAGVAGLDYRRYYQRRSANAA